MTIELPDDVQGLIRTAQPPGLGPERREGVWDEAEVRRAVVAAVPESGARASRLPLVEALVLLWHDHLDASHQLVQDLTSGEGSWIHAIMHRREPDYWNSKYWYRRVGGHPAFETLATEVGNELGKEFASPRLRKVLMGGRWVAFAMVDAVETAVAAGPGSSTYATLLRAQELEFRALLAHCALRL